MRNCKKCTLCCEYMEVQGVATHFEVCPNTNYRGCSKYAERPDTCKQFFCMWARGEIPQYLYPPDCGMVLASLVPDLTGGQACVIAFVKHVERLPALKDALVELTKVPMVVWLRTPSGSQFLGNEIAVSKVHSSLINLAEASEAKYVEEDTPVTIPIEDNLEIL